MRAHLLVNPASGRGRGARRLPALQALAAARRVPLAVSRSGLDLEVRARRAAARGTDRLLVAGGDGTLHRAVQGLAGTGCALGILPLGSGNDLAAALGVPADLAPALEHALTGPVRKIDLGRAGGRLFAGVAGVGFDSLVAERSARPVPLLRGPLIYVAALLRVLAGFVPPTLSIRHDGGGFQGRAMFAVLANAPRYGGGMRIAPGAELDDGLLELVIVRQVSRLELLRVFPRVYSGRHLDHPAVSVFRTRAAAIATDRPLPVYGDGEPMATAGPDPVPFATLPRALRVIAGA